MPTEYVFVSRDGVAASRTSSSCFKCLDHAEDSVQQPPSCNECRALPTVRRQQRWDYFFCFDMSLQCDKSEQELVIDGVKIAVLKCPMPLPFIMPAEMEASPPKDDDKMSLVSATSASHGSAVPTSVLPAGEDHSWGHVGLLLPPPLIPK